MRNNAMSVVCLVLLSTNGLVWSDIGVSEVPQPQSQHDDTGAKPMKPLAVPHQAEVNEENEEEVAVGAPTNLEVTTPNSSNVEFVQIPEILVRHLPQYLSAGHGLVVHSIQGTPTGLASDLQIDDIILKVDGEAFSAEKPADLSGSTRLELLRDGKLMILGGPPAGQLTTPKAAQVALGSRVRNMNIAIGGYTIAFDMLNGQGQLSVQSPGTSGPIVTVGSLAELEAATVALPSEIRAIVLEGMRGSKFRSSPSFLPMPTNMLPAAFGDQHLSQAIQQWQELTSRMEGQENDQ
ncbi:MAG: hypothetical protein KDB22_23855 [Planctomycetales bacterium]|nr:hypothetical protein [Planctomycetales bacterium]